MTRSLYWNQGICPCDLGHYRGHLCFTNTSYSILPCISLFCNYFPLEMDLAVHLNKLESPSPKDAMCQVWFKLAQWSWRRILNFVNVFLLFRSYLPLEKDVALHLNKLESASSKDALCQVWFKLAQWFLRRI